MPMQLFRKHSARFAFRTHFATRLRQLRHRKQGRGNGKFQRRLLSADYPALRYLLSMLVVG